MEPPKLAAAAEVAAVKGSGGTATTHPHQVADSGLHGRHRGGEVRDGLAVHLPLLVHDDQVGDLLGHWLQDALDSPRVEDGHGGGGGAGTRSPHKLLANSVPLGSRPTEKAAASAKGKNEEQKENRRPPGAPLAPEQTATARGSSA